MTDELERNIDGECVAYTRLLTSHFTVDMCFRQSERMGIMQLEYTRLNSSEDGLRATRVVGEGARGARRAPHVEKEGDVAMYLISYYIRWMCRCQLDSQRGNQLNNINQETIITSGNDGDDRFCLT